MSLAFEEIDKITQQCIGEDPPPCQAACPLHIDARGYSLLISQGNFAPALKLIRERLPFPGILGRVCTHPCETACARVKVDEAIAIAALKRSAADYAEVAEELSIAEEKHNKVAIIGAGPAGLMAAYDLRKMGYQVTVFDALPHPGGMLLAGIPPYRLPRDLLEKELRVVERLGVQFRLNTRVGEDIPFHQLKQDFDAIFIASGAHRSTRLGIPGEELDGVSGATDFLRAVNLGGRAEVRRRVAVVGGGNAALDAARTALRLGAKEVTILYRRSREEMPALPHEVKEAEREGINILFLAIPTRIVGKEGTVAAIECLRAELGEPDESGRRRPIPTPGSEFTLGVDTLIVATGQAPQLSFLAKEGRLAVNSAGTLPADPLTLETGAPGIFAGGDVVSGPQTVVEALAAGRKAAMSIDRYLRGEDLRVGREGEGPQESRIEVDTAQVTKKSRALLPTLPLKERTASFAEAGLGFSEEEAVEEAGRCLQCECRVCIKECNYLEKVCHTPRELAEKFRLGYFREKPHIPYSCNLCDLCEKVCPHDLNIGKVAMELRRQLVAEGLAPLPQHKLVKKEQEWNLSEAVTLSLPDPNTGGCERVFFPGCNLAAYSPSVVVKTYQYLTQRLADTGILIRCCGSPTHMLAEEDSFAGILTDLESELGRLGASEMIMACPECYKTLKQCAPELKMRTLYEVLLEVGLPETAQGCDAPFSLHDPCTTRAEPELQHSVRKLAEQLGCRIEEMEYSGEKTRCCGMGGMILVADFDLARSITKRRAEEAPCDILTYCASCREALAQEKPTLHILDLIFNPNWKEDKLKPPTRPAARKENQSQLREQLLGNAKG